MIGRGRRQDEKRRSPRLAQPFTVTVLEAETTGESTTDSDGNRSYWTSAVASKAIGMSLSKGGLAFQGKKPYREGTILAFEVALPEPEESFLPLIRRFVQRQMKGFRALCQVVWVGALSSGCYCMGTRFINTSDERTRAVEELIVEHEWQRRLVESIDDSSNELSDMTDGWDQL
jgi:hypothetical protein